MTSMQEAKAALPANWRLLLLAPGALALALYARTLAYGYVWDDTLYLTYLPLAWDWDELSRAAFGVFNVFYYRPLALLLLGTERAFSAGQPMIFHLDNVLLHAINSVLVAALGARVARRAGASALAAGVLSGLFYAAHPVLIEGVAWISARFDLLCTTFCLLTLLLDRALLGRAMRVPAVALSFFLALCSKEMAVSLLLILPLWQWSLAPAARFTREDRRVLAAAALAFVLYLLLRSHALGGMVTSPLDTWRERPLAHLDLVCRCLSGYVMLALNLFAAPNPVHPMPAAAPFSTWPSWIGLGMGLVAAMLAWFAIRRRPLALLAVCFFLSLLPVLQIVAVIVADNFVQERFMVFPLAFAALLAGNGWVALWAAQGFVLARRVLAGASAVFWLSASLLMTSATVPTWSDPLALWMWSYQHAPDSIVARANLLFELNGGGLRDQALSLAQYTERTQAASMTTEEYLIYAELLEESGQLEDAARKLDRAAAIAPPEEAYLPASIHAQRARLALDRNDLPTAESEFRSALRYRPRHPYSACMLGATLIALGRREEGERWFAQGLSYAPKEDAAQFEVSRDLLLKKATSAGVQHAPAHPR
ncbi:MAG TPA: hypothetical protein VHE37_00915 [Nevskiaceae bacterium]|nr:hypothetical protein [Nevskiaceae bacterium]